MNGTNKSAQIINVKCPKCETESEFTIYGCINATEENGLIQKVKDGSMFRHTCPNCQQDINIEYSFLYHQVDDALMIHYIVKDDETAKVIESLTNPSDEQKPVINGILERNTIIRIVRTKPQLYEKLAIYESGSDDRVVEILKLIVVSKFKNEKPDANVTDVFFNIKKKPGESDEEGIKVIQIYCDKKLEAEAEVNDTLYKKVFDDYVAGMPVLRADRNIIVNGAWASQTMKLKNATPNPAD